ncbi:MAG: type II toxin-antitoxin system VapC family toxin [Anaerolineae bacterium]|nr:type II toxin-antitoxin system VapC family toxin [Anaerolineae bacterium]
MKYLLDTNTCIRYINGRAPQIRQKMSFISDKDIVVCAITRAEMAYGVAKSQHPELSFRKQLGFLSRFESLPFDDACAKHFGMLRAQLEKAGTPIGAYDMQIAAIALEHNLIVVTHNVREFSRVQGLNIEDWEV